jgi:hypothetical protein
MLKAIFKKWTMHSKLLASELKQPLIHVKNAIFLLPINQLIKSKAYLWDHYEDVELHQFFANCKVCSLYFLNSL